MSLARIFETIVGCLKTMDDLLFPDGAVNVQEGKRTCDELSRFIDAYMGNTQFMSWGGSTFCGPKGGIYCSENICLRPSKEHVGTIFSRYFVPIDIATIDQSGLSILNVRIEILNPQYRDFLTTLASDLETYLDQKIFLENPFLDA